MYKIKKERPSTHTVLAFTEPTLHHLLQDCKFTQVIKLNLQFEKDTGDFSQHHLGGLKNPPAWYPTSGMIFFLGECKV